MGKHLYINSDESLEWDAKSWITTSIVFHSIFDRVETFFRPEEESCRKDCFEERGVGGLLLEEVNKSCFNIFHLRCRLAMEKFPDEKWMQYESTSESRRNSYTSIIYEWKEIVKRLEMDKRFDAQWIENYQRSLGEIA